MTKRIGKKRRRLRQTTGKLRKWFQEDF